MSQKSGKEFEVIVEGGKNRKKLVTLPIVANSAGDEAREMLAGSPRC